MSIENHGDEVALICDECGQEHAHRYHQSDFHDLVHAAKLQGWKFDRVRGEWLHTCPECLDELDEFGLD